MLAEPKSEAVTSFRVGRCVDQHDGVPAGFDIANAVRVQRQVAGARDVALEGGDNPARFASMPARFAKSIRSRPCTKSTITSKLLLPPVAPGNDLNQRRECKRVVSGAARQDIAACPRPSVCRLRRRPPGDRSRGRPAGCHLRHCRTAGRCLTLPCSVFSRGAPPRRACPERQWERRLEAANSCRY